MAMDLDPIYEDVVVQENCRCCWRMEVDGFADCVSCGYPTCPGCLRGVMCRNCAEVN